MYSSNKELRDIQKVCLNMAKYFVEFCEEHDLLCYLCGGGAIGAIREGGFIPWDDDLDFFMPRKDYNRLYELWCKHADVERFAISKPNKHTIDHNNFITIRDSHTTMIKPYQSELNIVHGIPLDIFPIDIAPETKIKRKIQKGWAIVRSLYATQLLPQNHGKTKKIIAKILLGIVPSSTWRYYIWSFAEKQMTKYENTTSNWVTELCVGPRYMGKIYAKKNFEKAVWVDFENTRLPIPIGYDEYLREAFGNYMKRPSENKQIPHHDVIKVDPHNPYTKYINQDSNSSN
ncbi:LicD family protein [Atopobacter phocae]|uniref:LicD family protein n=1 Tax=Atopobacter phocae TaxID=136492 RepID=UPI0004725416|nr:LicD family protein [Atopobacter phocae]